MKNTKNAFSHLSPQTNDDIRTIPDFYDNLYPTHEPLQSSIITTKRKSSKKSESLKNKKKSEEK